ncbi:hypothetical protein Saro_2978 [Novosphingobium aromaticivorans DSM 12444]|jgi:glutathione S-transferase|uniref:Uncharacterized protein n=1 Tax=Novosphingobium aromaticivorans (strain ATCC 700278 / DSM 12444 / CCUG 56034 / CIP 105152 / NBRC 16084 / F199) TaxID=279238 RepID=Q2G410_NOVAD|nr:hypothetical protein [Novosphingobium aromaticivorans]ABD27413.1 hypothetical protein Saro_2978 [Novosphingobium aromaticivorans DSM 12444]SCY68814.1 hypothetical protein SAMN05660666_02477 [Novosphingobium aromaticivorans]
MTDVPVSQEAREARIARYLSNEKAARESLATYPESTRQRLEAWQTEQCEWFSDTILEIVAEFITIDDAIRQQAERGEVAAKLTEDMTLIRGMLGLYAGVQSRVGDAFKVADAALAYALPTPPAGEA